MKAPMRKPMTMLPQNMILSHFRRGFRSWSHGFSYLSISLAQLTSSFLVTYWSVRNRADLNLRLRNCATTCSCQALAGRQILASHGLPFGVPAWIEERLLALLGVVNGFLLKCETVV